MLKRLSPLVALWLTVVAYAGTPPTLVAKVDRVSDGDTVMTTTSEGTTLRLRSLGSKATGNAPGKRPHIASGEGCRIC